MGNDLLQEILGDLNPAQREAVQAIKVQLAEDEAALKRREAGDEGAHISLLAKWLPSDNTSSPRTRKTAARLIQALGMEQKAMMDFLVNRARIAVNDGTFFGEQGRGWIRVNLATQRANVVRAFENLREAIRSR